MLQEADSASCLGLVQRGRRLQKSVQPSYGVAPVGLSFVCQRKKLRGNWLQRSMASRTIPLLSKPSRQTDVTPAGGRLQTTRLSQRYWKQWLAITAAQS